jgi:transmembrane sensor
MNSSQQHHDSAADEQAALWAARLDGDTLDRAQRAELDAWLARKPAHRALLSQYCQFSADLEEQVPALVSAGAVTMPAAKPAKRSRFNFPLFAGIALAAAAVVAVTIHVVRPAPQVQHFAKASAQRGTAILADGTRVELNANTSLRFENTKTERRVILAGGEAWFAVAKDPNRPFYVVTPAGSVRVTGTTFNVRTEPSTRTFEVTVIEGSVEVHSGDTSGTRAENPVLLGAGNQYSNRRGKSTLSPSDLDDTLAWRKGIIVFYDVPLSEALPRFAQYHGCAINVAPEVAGEPLGGRYGIDDLKGFLADLELALPRVKVHDDKLSGAVTVSLRPGS